MKADIRPQPAVTKQTVPPAWRRAVIWMASRELWWMVIPVAAMVFINQLPWHWVLLAVAVVPVVWLLRLAAVGSLTARTPLDFPILLVLLMAIEGLYPSVDLSVSLPVLAKMAVEFGLFYSLVNAIRSQRGAWEMAGLLVAAGAVVSLLALVNTEWISTKIFVLPIIYDRLPRLLPMLNKAGFHPNIIGGTLDMLLPLNVGLLFMVLRGIGQRRTVPGQLDSSAWWPKHPLALAIVLSLTLGLIGGTLVLTQSRGAWLGVAVALIVMAIWWRPRMAWILLIVALGIFLLVQRVGVTAITDFFLVSDEAVSRANETTQFRLEVWSRAIYMLQDFPYTGIGLGTFTLVMPVLYPVFTISETIPHAHNLWLQTGVDLGLPGLVAYMGILMACFCVPLYTLYRNRHQVLAPLSLACAGALIAFMVHGLVDYVIFSTKPGTVLWAIMGLTIAVWRITT